MRRYTERIRFTLPSDEKERLRLRAKLEGISLSELLRRILDKDIPGLKK
jgi:hypothetical protein